MNKKIKQDAKQTTKFELETDAENLKAASNFVKEQKEKNVDHNK